MNRLVGLVLAAGVVGIGGSAHAQMPTTPYGGFGVEYAQTPPPNTYVLNRWWMVEATPAAGATLPPQVVVEQPATAPVHPANPRRAARAARRARAMTTAGVQPYGTAGLQNGTMLPTGSLYWPGSTGVTTYSPVQRYSAYGQGYGISPYGSADYGYQYKGIYWGR